LWHRRFGHAGFENLAKLAKGKLAVGVKVGAGEFWIAKLEVYEPCILAKQTRTPFSDGEIETSGVLELVHMDVCGPMEKRSKGGSRFFATFMDDYSKLLVAIPIEKKSKVVAVVRNTVARLELQSRKKLKAVRTDRESEYVNGEMAAYFREKGVVHQTTARYSLEQNRVAERLNRVLMERARAMFIESGLRDEMWAEAVVTASYIRNRTPVSAHGKTPWEAFYEKKPDVSHMRVFGARAFMHVPGALRHRLEPVSEKGWFIGYEADAKAYRNLRERDNRVIVSRDVIVDERAKGNEPRSEI
jgi:transposase InsO family protein